MNLRHGVMKPTISVGQISMHSLRSIAIKVLIIKQRVYTSKMTDWQIKGNKKIFFFCNKIKKNHQTVTS